MLRWNWHLRDQSDGELVDLRQYINTIVTHITDGNKIESEVTSIMGGTVYESDSIRLRREGREEMQPVIDEQRLRLEQQALEIEQKNQQLAELKKRLEALEAARGQNG